jgi:hypothetical protein
MLSQKVPISKIKAKFYCITMRNYWIPAFAGMTSWWKFEFLRIHQELVVEH